MTKNRDSKFLSPENWHLIKRGWIYEAAIPYTGERPLDFFIRDTNNPNKGSIVKGNGNFVPGQEHLVVLGLKQRKVIVVSNDDLCQDKNIFDVTVAPIYSIYEEDKKFEWYNDVVNGNHLFYSYLSKDITGRECVVDLSNIITIGKNMLLNDKHDATSQMQDIHLKMEYCLQLGIYKKRQEVVEEDAV
ncbi:MULTISPECIES: hypothetical protein [Paenibacillus]|uniref:Uncharacterized protein n=1 Tax=Paenibacillus antibioticophila TaxID=1274374 RepID=A0A919Y000_9BACL|nr:MULTISPECIES: hypothetical protein [Paenibacillus]MDU0332766.1 hypothetical protein [Paenibacillus sp. 3LSP]GIO39485.1 hypothetical protein J41TS12_43460 [Paenibacillus antibioticophila]SMF68252.1 hypothetical protein SAMN02744102_04507 [Paenibacillus barengoltzii]